MGRSFRLYVWLGVVIVGVRVVFWIVFGGWSGGRVLLDLPGPAPDWVAGVTLLGPLYAEALLFALYDGLRLATIVICVGAANSVANPKRLLRSVPPALYEIGTALVVAVTMLPQFADRCPPGARRPGPAGRRDRPGASAASVPGAGARGRPRALAALAAGMDARGYGRAGERAPRSVVPPGR